MAAPSNGTARVWCVTVPELTPNASVVVTSLGTYGVNDLFADNDGKLYLWLPNDNYDFTAGGTEYEATVSDADTTATAKAPPVLDAYLTFSSADTFKITPSAVSWYGELFYSTDATNWNAFTGDGATAANNGAGEFRLYFRGKNNTLITGGNLSYWIIDADTASVACSGNIETLLDYTIVEAGNHPTMAANCFANLFKNCTALSSAPELAATNLSNNCYVRMFMGCTGLTAAPALPATTVTGCCYQEMFEGCTSLTQAPVLPAMTLGVGCYIGMFSGCTGLTAPPALPALTLATYCYKEMFYGCTDLTQAPALPATNLIFGCYFGMFHGCTELTAAPELRAAALVQECYKEMFYGCTKLNNIRVNFNSWADDVDATLDWVYGVSSTGTFVCPAELDTSVEDESHVPVGWSTGLPTGISSVTDSPFLNGVIYNISGQRVGEQERGIIIENGRKYFNR